MIGALLLDSTGAPRFSVTTLRTWIKRQSDKLTYDFNDSTFKAAGSVTTKYLTVPEVSAANDPGGYEVNFDTSLITNAIAGDVYIATIEETGTNAHEVGVLTLSTLVVERVLTRSAPGDGMTLTTGERTSVATTLLDQALFGHTTAGTVGKSLSFVDVASSTLAVPGSAMTLTSGERTTSAAVLLGTSVPAAFSAGTVGYLLGTNLTAPNALATGTAQAGAATSITLASGASATDNLYRHTLIAIVSGTGAGQVRSCSFYTGSTKVAVVTKSWLVIPDATSVYAVLPWASDMIIASGLAQSGSSTTITLSTTSNATDNLLNGAILAITAGTGVGQLRLISSYVGATKVATIDEAWATTPDSTSVYEIAISGRARVASIESTALTAIQSQILTDATPFAGTAVAHTGDAMALTPAERTAVQAKILSDATPFAGVNIAHTGDAMTLTAGERTAIQAKILSDATPFAGVAIAHTGDAMTLTSGERAAINSALVAAHGLALPADVTSSTATITAAIPSAATNATTLLDQALSGHTTAGTAGKALSNADVAASTLAVPGSPMTLTAGERTAINSTIVAAHGVALPSDVTASTSAVNTHTDAAVAPLAVPGSAMTLTAGERTSIQSKIISDATPFVGANIDVQVSTRLAASGYTAPPTSAANATAIWTQALPGAFAGGSAGAIVGTNLDTNIGSRLATAGYTPPPTANQSAAAVWDELTAASTTANSFGLLLKTNLDINVASRLATAGYAVPPSAAANATAVWQTSVPGAFSSGQAGFVLGTNLDATISSRLPTSSYAAPPGATVIAAAVWDELTAASTTANSFGALVKLQLDAAVTSRMATFTYTTPPTVGAISTQVRADIITDHGAGSYITATGFSTLTAAQVWATVVPGAFSSGQAGYMLGNLPTTAAPTAVAISTQVNADLTTAHGSGSYQTATGFATSGALSTAQGDITAIKGAGFTAGADDLHSARVLQASKASQASVDTALADLVKLLGLTIAYTFTVATGSTASSVLTNATQADDFFRYSTLLIVGSGGTKAVTVDDYRNVNGEFLFGFSGGFPFTPQTGDIAYVLSAATPVSPAAFYTHTDDTLLDNVQIYGDTHWATATSVSVAPNGLDAPAITTAAIDKIVAGIVIPPATIGPVTLQDGALDASAIGSGFVAAVQAGLATPADVATARDHVEAHVDMGLAAQSALLATAQASVDTLVAGVHVASVAVDAITGTSIASSAVTKLQAGLATAATAAAAVWATADGVKTMGEALKAIRQWSTWNPQQPTKKTLSSDGLHVTVTGDDGVTPIAVVPVASLGGAAVTPSTGESVTLG